MRKRNLEVFKKAVELAQSGEYKDWKSIEKALVGAGFHRAPDLLDGDRVRTILNTICEQKK